MTLADSAAGSGAQSEPELVLLLAMSRNGCIGVNNSLPWHLRDDLLNFKRLSSGHAIIMGRKTFDSIGRALPNRHNIVVSRQSGLDLDGCDVVDCMDRALEIACAWSLEHEKRAYFVIGGADIYRQTIDRAEQMYLTVVDADVQGDAWFAFDDTAWQELARTEFHQNDDNDWNFSILHLKRKTQ